MLLRHEPPTVMAFFGPWVGIEQECLLNHTVRQHVEQIPRIAGMDTQIIQPCVLHLAQQHRDAVDKRFAPDEPFFRIVLGLMHQMFATAKADFQPQGPTAEQRVDIQLFAVRVFVPTDRSGRQGRQIVFQIFFLLRSQGLALEPTIEIAPRGARGVLFL